MTREESFFPAKCELERFLVCGYDSSIWLQVLQQYGVPQLLLTKPVAGRTTQFIAGRWLRIDLQAIGFFE